MAMQDILNAWIVFCEIDFAKIDFSFKKIL